MLCHPCILGHPKQRGTKSHVATSPLPSRGPKRGRKCYVTPAFSGINNKGEQNENWLPHHCLLGGPKEGRNAMSPLHSRPSQTKGNKIERGYLTPAFSGAQKRAKMLCHPCILGHPKQRGTKSHVATSPLPSRGPKRGRKCYVTPAFSGIPNKGEQNQTWLPHPCLLGGANEGVNAMSPLHSRASQTKGNKIRHGYLTPAFSGAQKRAEMLCHPCILGHPKQRGTKLDVATSPLPSWGRKRGRKCCATPVFSGTSKKGEQNQTWLPHPYLLGPKRGLCDPCIIGHPKQRATKLDVAASPVSSWGPKRARKCYVTP